MFKKRLKKTKLLNEMDISSTLQTTAVVMTTSCSPCFYVVVYVAVRLPMQSPRCKLSTV